MDRGQPAKAFVLSRRLFLKQSLMLGAAFAAAAVAGCQVDSTSTSIPVAAAVPTASPSPNPPPAFDATPPLSLTEAASPVALEISAIGLMVDVAPMLWEIVDTNGERSTQWTLPAGAAGWHSDSAGAGAAGNVIISGRQQGEDAVFAPLVLGLVQLGQWVQLRSADGATYLYQITDIGEPIPLEGATPAQLARQRDLYAVGDQPRLTLITGWPEFTTTHRLFITADFRGRLR